MSMSCRGDVSVIYIISGLRLGKQLRFNCLILSLYSVTRISDVRALC